MNTNKLRSIIMLVTMMLTTVVIISCGPEEPEPPSPPTPEPEPTISSIGIKTPMAKKLVSVDKIWDDGDYYGSFFVYNDAYLTAYGTEEPVFFEDMAFVRYENHDGEIEKMYDIKTNKDGFITSYKFSDIRNDDYVLLDYKSEYECSYSDKHLTKISERYSGFETRRGNTERYIGSCTYSYKWTDDHLTQIDMVESGTEGNYHITADIMYGDQINKFKQFTWGLVEGFDDFFPYDFEDEYYMLPLVGLFGEGPTYLPTRIRVTYSDSSHSDKNYNYKLNNDGSIAEESEIYVKNTMYNKTYRYFYIDQSNIAPRPTMPVMMGNGHSSFTHKSHRERILERMQSNR